MCINFPSLTGVYIDLDTSPEIASAYSVFVAPTVLLFTFGKESVRESRFIVLKDLEMKIARYLQLMS